jgi:hypothetical protein
VSLFQHKTRRIIINQIGDRDTIRAIEDEASGDDSRAATQPNVKKKTTEEGRKKRYSPHADARVRGPQIDPDGWSFRFRGHDSSFFF